MTILRKVLCSVPRLAARSNRRNLSRIVAARGPTDDAKPMTNAEQAKESSGEQSAPWEDPFKYAVPQQTTTYTDFKEADVDWRYVERLLPPKLIPEMPKGTGVTPSGWRPPQDPAPNLQYYIRRTRYHLPALFLERRRDQLNPKTMDYEYVELVALKQIYGDIFACEKDMREFLEAEVGHPVATYVDELKGIIKIKGAQRALVEKFVFEKGF